MRNPVLIAIAISMIFLTACQSHPLANGDTTQRELVIDNVTIVDTLTGELHSQKAVVIDGDQILQVLPAGSVPPGGPAKVIDMSGKFVVPGYNDMHVHNLTTANAETSFPLMLAYGITGIRHMTGSPEFLALRRSGKTLVPPQSPALLAMPGSIIVPGAKATPDELRAEVRKQKAEGADFIKLADARHEAYLAVLDEASEQGLPVAGHILPSVDIREAMTHGMDSIEHLGPGIAVLLSCSRDEAAIRKMIAAMPAPAHGPLDLPPAMLQKILANPMYFSPLPMIALIDSVSSTYDADKCRALAKDMAGWQMWQVPTLTRLEAMAIGDSSEFRDNPNNVYVPTATRQFWFDLADEAVLTKPPEYRKILHRLFDDQLRLAGLLDEAGVKMMAGTDFGGAQWITPGALHHEFDLLARAGISPFHILQMTTINPARFLNREASMGTVEPGKNADLVLLDANPLVSVDNLHRIAAVVRAGRFYSRDDLDALKRKYTPQ